MTGYIFDFQGKQFTPDGQAEARDTGEHNKALSRAEVDWFMREKPNRHFAYVKTNQGPCICGVHEALRTSTGPYVHRKHDSACPATFNTPIAVQTWIGDKLGVVTWCGSPYKVPGFGGWPSTRQNLRVKGINGRVYSAVYYVSSGDYCRMKAFKDKDEVTK